MSTSSLNRLEVNMADQSSTLSGAKRKLTLEGMSPNKRIHCSEEIMGNQDVGEFLGQVEGNTWPERWSIPGA